MQTKPSEMSTLTDVLERLRKKHTDNEYIMTDEGFTPGNGKYYNPDELTIIKTYRFEGQSDPGDNSILYLIQSNDGTLGYSLDAYGMYSSHEGPEYDEFIKKIPVDEREEQAIFS